MPNNPFFEMIFKLLAEKMNDSSSKFYLPELLKNQKPSYEPYLISKWDIGEIQLGTDSELIGAADAICSTSTIGNHDGKHQGNPKISMTNIKIAGLSNVKIDGSPIFDSTDDSIVSCKLLFSTLSNPNYPPLSISGSFDLTQGCYSNTAKQSFTQEGQGTFTYSNFYDVSASATFQFSVNNDKLTCTVKKIDLYFNVGDSDNKKKPKVKITSGSRDREIQLYLSSTAALEKVREFTNSSVNSTQSKTDLENLINQQLSKILS